MPKWTKEQTEAIYKEGMPILVSAGAGSGKTAVLTERVLRKVKEGVSLNQLLILTFTKAAAREMKERIRKSLLKENLLEEAEQVDAAYITTFDSFALSCVKKYHYLLNIPSNISIVDSSMIELEKEKIINEIFENRYQNHDFAFENLISQFCVKDDKEVKNDLLNIHNKLDLKYDKIHYIKNYIETEMTVENYQKQITAYMEIIQNKIAELKSCVESLESIDANYYSKIDMVFNRLWKSDTYQEVRENVQVSIPKLPPNNDPLKKLKETIADGLKELKRLTRWDTTDDIIEDLEDTKKYIEVFISILLELEANISKWKYANNVFEFHDIAKFAIQVVQENPMVQSELRQMWNEILLDEYQDTSDLQEMFIASIANENVYMVGDMKQSIYRFRNANPILFKEKYDHYKVLDGGIKIDLIQNFRSRKEPLEDINIIFNRILQDETGGADYEKEHQMVFGNQIYEEQKANQNMHMKLITYESSKEYTQNELEAFIVAKDIKEKIDSHFQVMDSKTQMLRDVTYQDFVILVDRSTGFDLYREIFEYEKIPLAVHKDETITSGEELRLIYHILKCLQCVENNLFDTEWKYAFVSIMRSYLMEENDASIFGYIQNGNYNESKLYSHIQNLLHLKNHLNNELLLQAIIEEFDFYSSFIKVGKVESRIVKMEYLLNLASRLSKMGFDCYGMMDFLKEIDAKNYEIRFSQNLETENSVSIMTIHKSKGLEYPICYYTGLCAKFNKADLKERMTFDSAIGFIMPTANNGIQNTILKDLLRYSYQKQEIAEKIRLFYVALTRSREQIIMVMPRVEEEVMKCKKIKPYQALSFKCFYDMLKSIYGDLENYVEDASLCNLTKDYKMHTSLNKYFDTLEDTLVVHKMVLPDEIVRENSFSKKIEKPIDYQQYRNIELGKMFHQILEYLDFEHPDYRNVPEFFQKKISAFLSCSIFQDKIIHIYKEYEFYRETSTEQLHGIIDLMIEYENEIKIVDYKLKQITDDAYFQQLRGYQSYIESITDKKVSTYLYSIMDGTLEEIGVVV